VAGEIAWYTYKCPSCNARIASRIGNLPRVGAEYAPCGSCKNICRTPDIEWQHMTKWQRVRYFMNEYVFLILLLAVLFAIRMYYATAQTDWKPSAWILGVTLALFTPFWLRKYFLVQKSINRTASVGPQHFGTVQGLDNVTYAGTISAGAEYTPPAQPYIPKPKGGISLYWKIRLGFIGIVIIVGILDNEWKTIDKYFPKLNEYIHAGTPTSEGDVDYLSAHLQQDMEKWAQTCPEKIGFKECRTRLIANKPVLTDLSMRVTALNDAWVKELGERTVPNDCRIQMNQMLVAYKDYVRVEGTIVALVEPMGDKVDQSKVQPLNAAFDKENKAVDELQNLKSSHACDGY
jgi:hypothetical protein